MVADKSTCSEKTITMDEIDLGFELWKLSKVKCLPTLEDVRHLWPTKPFDVQLIREILNWSEDGNS